jgi:hypothetical protein
MIMPVGRGANAAGELIKSQWLSKANAFTGAASSREALGGRRFCDQPRTL